MININLGFSQTLLFPYLVYSVEQQYKDVFKWCSIFSSKIEKMSIAKKMKDFLKKNLAKNYKKEG